MQKDADEIKEILSRGLAEFIDPDGIFERKLKENPQEIVIKFGVDPTRPDIHLGHSVVLRKLRKLQDLGCKVVFLIGDLTAQIGDPSGKSKVRPEIDQAQVEANMKTYLDQVGKILNTDPNVFTWIRNSDWFVSVTDIIPPDPCKIEYNIDNKKIEATLPGNNILSKAYAWEQSRMQKGQIRTTTFINLFSILRRISFSRLIERDFFQERIRSGKELYIHEMLYPVLQGIDSTVIYQIYGTCDLEVGGTDQTFNMLMARDIMKIVGQEPQSVMAFELLEGLDGKEKMSKSLDNYVSITDEPDDMFGKIMSLPDNLIVKYFEFCTYTPMDAIAEIKDKLSSGSANPRDIKMRLAQEIVEIYHGHQRAADSLQFFQDTFSKGKIPENIETVELEGAEKLSDIVIKSGLVSSKSEYRRLLDGGAVEYMEKEMTISDIDYHPTEDGTYRIGKKKFIKIKSK